MSVSGCCFAPEGGPCLRCGVKRKKPEDDDDEGDQHPASWIVVLWQKDYSRAWRWNNAHRHISDTPRVPLWDDSSCLVRYATRPTIPFLIPLTFVGAERNSIFRIRIIRYNMHFKETMRLQRKRVWWRRWVIHPEGYKREYELYIRERSVPGLWLSLALDHGLTFRHLRSYGYRKYVDLAGDLEAETDDIDTRVALEVVSGKYRTLSGHVYRPYLFNLNV